MQLDRDDVTAHPIAENLMDEQFVDQRAAGIVAEDAVEPRDVAVQSRRCDHQENLDPIR